MNRLLTAALAFALAACASVTTPLAKTHPAPAARTFYVNPERSDATMIVIRDRWPGKPPMPREIWLDGTLVGVLDEEEHLELKVAAGNHLIGGRFNARTPFADGRMKMVTVMVEPGRTYYFRAGGEDNGVTTFFQVTGPDA